MSTHAPAGYACPFCALLDGRPGAAPVPSDVVAETERALAFVAPRWWPHNRGHVLVIPRTHVENLYGIGSEDLHAVMDLVRTVATAMRSTYPGCTGVSTRQHNEPDGGQDVWHLHTHVFPRYPHDDVYGSAALPGFQPADERAVVARRLRDGLERQVGGGAP